MNDIKYLTIFAVKESISSNDYLREIARIARNYGIYNWQTYPYTYKGIGRGIRNAQIRESEFHEFLSSLENQDMKNYLKEGYYN